VPGQPEGFRDLWTPSECGAQLARKGVRCGDPATPGGLHTVEGTTQSLACIYDTRPRFKVALSACPAHISESETATQ